MAMQNIVIVNTGCANISSVKFAVERLGVKVTVSDNTEIIQGADKVFLPGVGSANAAMASIEHKHLVTCIQGLTQPVLGICLGMQLMVEKSAESLQDFTPCLNLIPGEVKRMQVGELRLPHMGWNTVTPLDSLRAFPTARIFILCTVLRLPSANTPWRVANTAWLFRRRCTKIIFTVCNFTPNVRVTRVPSYYKTLSSYKHDHSRHRFN